LPALSSPDILEDIARVDGAQPADGTTADRPMPAGYWMFLLVPAVATFSAGRSAGSAGSGRRESFVRGAGAGVVFAVLVGVGSWFANVELVLHGAEGIGTSAHMLGPRPLPTALLALAWGVGGGALGASTLRQEEGTPVPVEPDEPVPPSPTSV
jgi:hypothetical protein